MANNYAPPFTAEDVRSVLRAQPTNQKTVASPFNEPLLPLMLNHLLVLMDLQETVTRQRLLDPTTGEPNDREPPESPAPAATPARCEAIYHGPADIVERCDLPLGHEQNHRADRYKERGASFQWPHGMRASPRVSAATPANAQDTQRLAKKLADFVIMCVYQDVPLTARVSYAPEQLPTERGLTLDDLQQAAACLRSVKGVSNG